jgi:Response regulator containing a CheY-like receiver domain and an HTH DNA-binding domain
LKTINVIIADDHSMVRQGIKQILELESDIVVTAQASNGREAVDLANAHNPDVLLMDINMPILNGLQAVKEIRELGLETKVIMLTINDDREYLFKALQFGAQGYMLKDAEPSVLIDAIRNVAAGDSYIQSNMTTELVKEFNRVTQKEKEREFETNLTAREVEVLNLIADGLLNKEIAKTLYISEKTVKNHVSSIFRKLNVNDRTQAAIYAFKNNLKA